jgi:hypothetical protein
MTGGDKTQVRAAAKPITIAVTGGGGLHYGVRYDTKELSSVYEYAAPILSAALNAAAAPSEINESEWQAALLSQGVYFEYMSPVSLSVLAGWFGAETAGSWGDMEVRRLCVAEAGRGTLLFFQQYDTGRFYAASTEAGSGLGVLADSIGTNSAVFCLRGEGQF